MVARGLLPRSWQVALGSLFQSHFACLPGGHVPSLWPFRAPFPELFPVPFPLPFLVPFLYLVHQVADQVGDLFLPRLPKYGKL